MLATIVHRGLTVWIDPVARSARIHVHMPGRPEEHTVLIQPGDGGCGGDRGRHHRCAPDGRLKP